MGMLPRIGQPTVIAAAPGFELVSLECADEIMCRPIIGWAVTTLTGPGSSYLIEPVALGCGPSIFGDIDCYAIKLPDGRVLSLDDDAPRYFKDAKVWAN